MIHTRIRFDGQHGAFYIQRRWMLFWIIPIWDTVKKKGTYSSDDPIPRMFEKYDDARTFAIKASTDIVIKHKRNEYDPMV